MQTMRPSDPDPRTRLLRRELGALCAALAVPAATMLTSYTISPIAVLVITAVTCVGLSAAGDDRPQARLVVGVVGVTSIAMVEALIAGFRSPVGGAVVALNTRSVLAAGLGLLFADWAVRGRPLLGWRWPAGASTWLPPAIVLLLSEDGVVPGGWTIYGALPYVVIAGMALLLLFARQPDVSVQRRACSVVVTGAVIAAAAATEPGSRAQQLILLGFAVAVGWAVPLRSERTPQEKLGPLVGALPLVLLLMIHLSLATSGVLAGGDGWGYRAWLASISELPAGVASTLALAQTPTVLLGLLSVGASAATSTPADWGRSLARCAAWSAAASLSITVAWHLASSI